MMFGSGPADEPPGENDRAGRMETICSLEVCLLEFKGLRLGVSIASQY